MSSFFEELKRRNVFRVAIFYLIGAWLMLQIADIIVPLLNLPGWTGRFILLMLGLGLPIALFFAWAYEITPDGLKKEKDVDRSESIAPKTGRKLDFVCSGNMTNTSKAAVTIDLIFWFMWPPAVQSGQIAGSSNGKLVRPCMPEQTTSTASPIRPLNQAFCYQG